MHLERKIIFIAIIIVALASCSSPESDGIKAAKRYNDAEKKHIEYLEKDLSEFIGNFNSYNFQTRLEVRKKINEIKNNADIQHTQNLKNAELYFSKVSEKYASNFNKNKEFQYAFNGYRNKNLHSNNRIDSQMEYIDALVYTIIPPIPNQQKLIRDLVGRRINDQPIGYHRKGWYWEVKSVNELKEVNIKSITSKGNDYVLDVYLLLQGEANQHEANVLINYTLGHNDDWTIEFIQTIDMSIVRTGKYDNLVTIRRTGWSGEYQLEITNHSDISLLVGGAILPESRGDWQLFSSVVNANSISTVGGLLIVSVRDYIIHFIERP